MTQVGIPAYRHCADWSEKQATEYRPDLTDRLETAAAELRKYRLKDSIGPLYDMGYYDGIEHALSVIEQQIKGSAA